MGKKNTVLNISPHLKVSQIALWDGGERIDKDRPMPDREGLCRVKKRDESKRR